MFVCLVFLAKSLSLPVEVLPGRVRKHKLMGKWVGEGLMRGRAFPWGEIGPSLAQTSPLMLRST